MPVPGPGPAPPDVDVSTRLPVLPSTLCRQRARPMARPAAGISTASRWSCSRLCPARMGPRRAGTSGVGGALGPPWRPPVSGADSPSLQGEAASFWSWRAGLSHASVWLFPDLPRKRTRIACARHALRAGSTSLPEATFLKLPDAVSLAGGKAGTPERRWQGQRRSRALPGPALRLVLGAAMTKNVLKTTRNTGQAAALHRPRAPSLLTPMGSVSWGADPVDGIESSLPPPRPQRGAGRELIPHQEAGACQVPRPPALSALGSGHHHSSLPLQA